MADPMLKINNLSLKDLPPPPSPPQNHIIVPSVENGFINLIMRDTINILNCCDLISPFV